MRSLPKCYNRQTDLLNTGEATTAGKSQHSVCPIPSWFGLCYVGKLQSALEELHKIFVINTTHVGFLSGHKVLVERFWVVGFPQVVAVFLLP